MKKKNEDFDYLKGKGFDVRKLIPIALALVALIIIIIVVILEQKRNANGSDQQAAVAEVTKQNVDKITDIPTVSDIPTISAVPANQDDQDDPQKSGMGSDSGAAVDVDQLLSTGDVAENNHVTIGIDVAKYQGTIDWKKVASSGIDFAMIRVGYRTQKTGELCVDNNSKYNMQEAQANGIKVGVYFFSTAITEKEAKEEADWVAEYISQYKITYPVAYDCEGFDQKDSRQYFLTNSKRTDIAIAFMQEIYKKGYTPIFYASMNELRDSSKWDTKRLESTYKIWVSQYPATPYPKTKASSYTGTHAMWQYTNRGTIVGITKPVDVNVAYFGYEGMADAKNDKTPEKVKADVEALINFREVNEKVTAKETTNLRDIPSQDSDSKVMKSLKNGDTATRTGVSSSGWSRVIYNGKTYYAVSSYLTTDLSYTVPSKDDSGSEDGLKTKFTDCDDNVTAKIEVNLRALPSITNPDAKVVAVLTGGETVTRTGINKELGWSRVVYNGQTLYCVSSYLISTQ